MSVMDSDLEGLEIISLRRHRSRGLLEALEENILTYEVFRDFLNLIPKGQEPGYRNYCLRAQPITHDVTR